MINILKEINSTTMIVEENNHIYIAKEISLDAVPVYKRLMQIENPNIVKLYKTDIVNDRTCIIQEYVQGDTLKEYVEKNGALSDSETIKIILQVCNGLSEIHNNGIVHRDITPTNIMICENGTVKIIDFGISRKMKLNQTQDTTILGTHGFAAPEQYGFSQTSAKSDIYSLGVLMNYLKTAKLPNDELAKGRFENIISKCIQVDETRRYEGIDEVVRDITNKGRLSVILSYVPGFRKSVWWHSVIACIYYFLYAFVFYSCLEQATSIKMLISMCGFISFFFFFPVFTMTNFLNWTNKLSFLKNKSKGTKILFQLLFTFLSIAISAVFIILYPTE